MKKHYVVYMEDSIDVFKLHVPAENEKKAREFVQGNGEVLMVKRGERTIESPISMNMIVSALQNHHFGQMEIDLITRALSDCEFID